MARAIGAASSLVLAVALALFVLPPTSAGRRLGHALPRMACFERPHTHAVVGLGDSLTAGSSVPALGVQTDDSWLSDAVCDDGVRYGYNAGVPSETTADMRRRVGDVLARRPSTVVVLAGTNDLLTGRDLDAAASDLSAITTELSRAHVQVVVGTVPPLPGDGAVDEWNARVRGLGYPVIDFHAAVAAPDGGRYRSGFVTSDGIHPTEAGAKAMAAAAARVLARLDGP